MRRKYTLAGHLLCTEREYLPIYTGRKMAEADLFLYQVNNGLPAPVVTLSEYSWFFCLLCLCAGGDIHVEETDFAEILRKDHAALWCVDNRGIERTDIEMYA